MQRKKKKTNDTKIAEENCWLVRQNKRRKSAKSERRKKITSNKNMIEICSKKFFNWHMTLNSSVKKIIFKVLEQMLKERQARSLWNLTTVNTITCAYV